MVVTVFGMGFVGLTTALGFAHLGHTVYGIDVDESKKKKLQKGQLPFMEPEMDKIINKYINKSFFVSDDIEYAIGSSDFVFYCVGTPYGENGNADLRSLFSAIDTTIDVIKDEKFRVLVTKSTIPPSTTKNKIMPYINSKGAVAQNIGIANNPEFLREGHCWDDFLNADRIVLGVEDETSRKMLIELYEGMDVPVVCVSTNTGEFIKYLSNTLLATLISYSNEMAQIADVIGGIDVARAFRVLHMDKRWNDADMASYVYPGCGYGGYCLPKDTNALYSISKAYGYEPVILGDVIKVNDYMPEYMTKRICEGISEESVIGVLGLSFKPGSDDVRDTPAAKIIAELIKLGYHNIIAYDPVAMHEFSKHYAYLNVKMLPDVKEVFDKADVLAVVTAWPFFIEESKKYDMKRIVDCRYCL